MALTELCGDAPHVASETTTLLTRTLQKILDHVVSTVATQEEEALHAQAIIQEVQQFILRTIPLSLDA